MPPLKVALIHTIISPYRLPVFNELAQLPGIELQVFFLSESASDRHWNTKKYHSQIQFEYQVLPNSRIKMPLSQPTDFRINPTIYYELFKQKFDVVVTSGWVDLACQSLPFLKTIYGFKSVVWAGSTKEEQSWQRRLTKPLVKAIVRQADALIAYGTKAEEYLLELGAGETVIEKAFNCIDVEYFHRHSQELTAAKKKLLRQKFGISENEPVLLYVGQFISRKNVETLLTATAKLTKPTTVVLVGYGPLKATYQQQATDLKLKLVMIDHVENRDIAQLYGLADVFILPSHEEVWGLVVNEAMAAHLPVLVSQAAGCAYDLVEPGSNGYIFDPASPAQLHKYLQQLVSNQKLRQQMGQASYRLIKKVNPRAAAQAMSRAIKQAAAK